MRQIQAAGFKRVFSTTTSAWPAARGHRRLFLRGTQAGVSPPHRLQRNPVAELLEAVDRQPDARAPRLGGVHLRPTDCLFLRPAEGRAGVQLGNMLMYLGAEKAGIRLADYRNVPFRVGEVMFDDGSFAPVKGKTNELSVRSSTAGSPGPELAYSETTAYPAHRLSADEHGGEAGRLDDQRRPQHDVHERAHRLSAGALADAWPGHETPCRTAPPYRRPRTSWAAQAFLGRGKPVRRRRQSLTACSWPWACLSK